MQVEHVRGGICELLLGKLAGGPVRALLLLRQLDPGQFGNQVLEPVAIRVRAHQLRDDLGAVDRRGDDAEVLLQHGDVEARKMEDLEDRLVGQQRLEIGSRKVAAVELHEVSGPVARRELDETEAVAVDVQPQRLGIDGDARPEAEPGGQVVLVQDDRRIGHRCRALAWSGLRWAANRYTPECFNYGSPIELTRRCASAAAAVEMRLPAMALAERPKQGNNQSAGRHWLRPSKTC